MAAPRMPKLALSVVVFGAEAAWALTSCGECNVLHDSDAAGNLVNDILARTVEECCAACDGMSACSAWSFENHWYWIHGSCKLKEAFGGTFNSRGLIAGIKRDSCDGPSPAPPAPPPSPIPGVRHLDLFRASSESGLSFTLEDNNMADVAGCLKYVHTETIVEHELAPYRTERKYNVAVIGKWAFQVKNTDKLLHSSLAQTSDPDFGPFVTFDYGKSTNPYFDDLFPEYGDWVGVQTQEGDPRIAVNGHMWWYSLGGRCPNMDFEHKGGKDSPNSECMLYRENPPGSNGATPINGGLCDGKQASPTGQPGCVYTYETPQAVILDDLAGLTSIDCGGRPCTGWSDFRANCVEQGLKRQFDWDGNIQNTEYCVEYDIHPSCARNCQDPNCLRLTSRRATVELGVPFWRGRCDAQQNDVRKAALLAAYGGNGQHKNTALKVENATNLLI